VLVCIFIALLRQSLVLAMPELLLLLTMFCEIASSGILYTSCAEPALAAAAARRSLDCRPDSANATVSALLCDNFASLSSYCSC
jgi:hypothetical protein